MTDPRVFNILFVIVLLCVSVGLLLYGIAQLFGIVSNQNYMFICMTLGIFGLIFGILMVKEIIAETPSPQDKAEMFLMGWQSALAQGDYQRAQTIVEKAMLHLPISYTQIPGMLTYVHQGQFDRALVLAQQVIHDRSDTKSKVIYKNINMPILSQVYCLMADIAMYQGDFDTAFKHLEKSESYKPEDILCFHVMAKFSLYQGDLERASLDLRTAAGQGHKLGQELSGLHLALQAWTSAQRYDHYNASTLIQQALAKTPSREKARLAEIHLIQGYVERSLLHPEEARFAFQAAVSCDPHGIYGSTARTELEKGLA